MDTQKDMSEQTSTAIPAPESEMGTAVPETQINATPVATTTPWYRRPLVIAIILALILLGGAVWYLYENNYKNGGIVATVNSAAIYLHEYEESVRLIEESAAGQGINPNDETAHDDIRKQALDSLIDNALLIDAARKANIVVTDAEAQEVYDRLATDMGGVEALTVRMAEIGITEEKLRSNIRERILVDTYLESVSEIESLTVTDEEIQAFIATHVPTDTELPPLEEIRPIIESQIMSLKQQEIIAGIISSLRAESQINVRL